MQNTELFYLSRCLVELSKGLREITIVVIDSYYLPIVKGLVGAFYKENGVVVE